MATELNHLNPILAEVAQLADRFQSAGKTLYLVGGIVRDALLAESAEQLSSEANDIDLTTDAHPSLIKDLIRPLTSALWHQGERFGTIGAVIAERSYEITTHRAELYDSDSRKPEVVFGTSVLEDLARRDFTINSLAVSLPGVKLIDPYDGVRDLKRQVLKTPLSPDQSFIDDPLRMLRAARFSARFGLKVDAGLVEAMSALRTRIEIISAERIHGELERLLSLPQPLAGLELLFGTGVFEALPMACKSADQLQKRVALAAEAGSAEVRRAALFGYGINGCDDAKSTLRALRYSKHEKQVTLGMLNGVELLETSPVDDRNLRVVVKAVGSENLEALLQLLSNIETIERQHKGRAARIRAGLEALGAKEDLSDWSAALTGSEIMDLLAIASGPKVGLAVRHLEQLRVDVGPITKPEAVKALGSWVKNRQ